jgi:hypothetical protein
VQSEYNDSAVILKWTLWGLAMIAAALLVLSLAI